MEPQQSLFQPSIGDIVLFVGHLDDHDKQTRPAVIIELPENDYQKARDMVTLQVLSPSGDRYVSGVPYANPAVKQSFSWHTRPAGKLRVQETMSPPTAAEAHAGTKPKENGDVPRTPVLVPTARALSNEPPPVIDTIAAAP